MNKETKKSLKNIIMIKNAKDKYKINTSLVMKPLNFKSGMIRWLLAMAVLQFFVLSSKAVHPDLDTLDVWVPVNDGFAKCAPLGQSAGVAWWAQDDWTVLHSGHGDNLLHKRGKMYAFIEYRTSGDPDYNNPTNTTNCASGLFRHDPMTNKWVRVAYYPEYLGGYYKNMDLLTNGEDIFNVYSGSVWRLVEPADPENYPTGWELISKEPHKI